MIDQLRALYIFAKTVELGSFRATAKVLRLSPSVVSYQITQLEKQYGVALLYRSTRKLSLTHDGERAYASAQRMTLAAEESVAELAGAASEAVGRISITMPASFNTGTLIPEIALFAQKHPRVKLEICYSDEQQDIIANGVDLAIRVGDMQDSSLKAKRLFDLPRKLLAAPEYVESRKRLTHPRDLVSWDWVQFSETPRYRVFRNKKGQTYKLDCQSQITVDNAGAMVRFLIEGCGVATPPLFLAANELESGKLVELLSNWSVDPITVYAVWHANAPREGLVTKFIESMIGGNR